MYKKGDFHLHTNASDGRYSPSELAINAIKNNIDIIAVTDHDTTKNITEALKYSCRNLKIIPGIELTTYYNDENIHILGYFKDDSYKSEEFQKNLDILSEIRRERAYEIIKRLKIYFDINIPENTKALSKKVIARPDIANAIIESGYNYTFNYIFDNILNKDSPAYVPSSRINIDDGIKILKNANALSVLAHPVLIKKTPVQNLLNFKFDGIEAIYPLNKNDDTNKFIELSKKYNKLITAGSDCHGRDDDKKHGKIGDVYLTNPYLELFIKKLRG